MHHSLAQRLVATDSAAVRVLAAASVVRVGCIRAAVRYARALLPRRSRRPHERARRSPSVPGPERHRRRRRARARPRPVVGHSRNRRRATPAGAVAHSRYGRPRAPHGAVHRARPGSTARHRPARRRRTRPAPQRDHDDDRADAGALPHQGRVLHGRQRQHPATVRGLALAWRERAGAPHRGRRAPLRLQARGLSHRGRRRRASEREGTASLWGAGGGRRQTRA